MASIEWIKRQLERDLGLGPCALDTVQDGTHVSALRKIHEELQSECEYYGSTFKWSTSGLGMAGAGVVMGLFNQLATASPIFSVTVASGVAAAYGVCADIFGSMSRDAYRANIEDLKSQVLSIANGVLPLCRQPGVFFNDDGEPVRYDASLGRQVPVSAHDFKAAEPVRRNMDGPAGP